MIVKGHNFPLTQMNPYNTEELDDIERCRYKYHPVQISYLDYQVCHKYLENMVSNKIKLPNDERNRNEKKSIRNVSHAEYH